MENGDFSRFLPLRIPERDGTRSKMGLNDAYHSEESFKLCLKAASHRKIVKPPTQNLKIPNIKECVGVIKNLNKNSKSSLNFASKGI